MLSDGTIKSIASIFCGDTGGYYTYKTGPALVSFFNQRFGSHDVYQSGFPSRWAYAYNKLVEFLNAGTFDRFLTLMLSKEFIISDTGCTVVEAAEKAVEIVTELNRILRADAYVITHKGNEYHLLRENDDLVFYGSGGFANVYRQKSTGLIVKKLKDDYLANPEIRSRFKREFNITKSLNDLPGIIRVFDFDETNCSYTMEEAEQTLEVFINNSTLNEETRIRCIRQILQLFSEVHKRDVIHRDISPNNIFLLSGVLKTADFGLGKDLSILTSHQTYLTNAFGQFYYCAPEQFMLLRDGDKRSDVYSLGRLINFIMTADPNNSRHIFRSAAEKATSSNPSFRQADAGALLSYVEKNMHYHQQSQNKERVLSKIAAETLDEEVETFLSELTNEQLCKMLVNDVKGFHSSLIKYMKQNDTHANDIIQGVEDEFREVCHRFEDNDPIARFANAILEVRAFPYVVKELAASILRYIAKDVNRFYAQRLIESLINAGVEPMIEEILLS
jgi:serine/threonine protein kinase